MAVQEEEVSLMDIIGVLHRHRYLIIGLTVFVTLLALIYSLLTRPVYRAEAMVRLSIATPPISVLTPEAGVGMVLDPVQSQIEIIKSRTVSERVVKRLGLNIKFPKVFKKDTAWCSDSVRPGTYKLVIKNKDTFEVLGPKGIFLGRGKFGHRFVSTDGRFGFVIRKKEEGFSQSEYIFKIRDPQLTAEGFKNKVKVMQKGNTDLAIIRLKAYTPRDAAMLTNAVAEEYVNFTLYDLRKEARSVRDFIQNQLNKIEKELEEAQDSLKKFKEQTGIFMLDEDARNLINRLSNLQAELTAATTEKVATKARINNLRAQLQQQSAQQKERLLTSPEISGNPVVQSLKDKLTELEIRKAKLMEEYTEQHPEVQAINREIEKTKDELRKAVGSAMKAGPLTSDPIIQSILQDLIKSEADLNALEGQIEALKKVISYYESRIKQLPTTEVRLAELTREVESKKATYNMLLSKLEDVKITEARTVSDAKVVDSAVPPTHPIKPKKKLNLILGFILGLMLGIGGAFVSEYLDTSIKVPEEIENTIGVPVLGTIPKIGIGISKGKAEELIQKRLITVGDLSSSPVAEAYRALRTNLKFSSISKPLRSIVITSSLAQEGKSTVTANLAITFAQLNHKVLLVDADLRKPMLHRIFGYNRVPGLTDVLVGSHRIDDVIHDLHRISPNLMLITSGQIPPNPAELLGSQQMEEFLEETLQRFEYIFFDTPPVLPATDASELSSKTDGVILVIKALETEREVVEQAKKMLDRAGANIVGAVLNAMDVERQFYYYKYRYKRYYYYYSYTHKDQLKEYEAHHSNPLKKFLRKIKRGRK